MIKEVKDTGPWAFVIEDLNCDQILKRFMNENCRTQINQSLELKKFLRRSGINYMLNGKDMIMHLIVGLKPVWYKNKSISSYLKHTEKS